MKDPTSTASLNTLISQEVLHPKEYNLAAEISQFSKFQDNWSEDLANEFKIQLDNQDDDSLLEDDPDSEADSKDDGGDDSRDDGDDSKDNEDDSKDDSRDDSKDDDKDDNKVSIFFALPSLTGYPRELSKDDVLRKLNFFAKKHGFALVTQSSKSKKKNVGFCL
jgi:hypothetical protein